MSEKLRHIKWERKKGAEALLTYVSRLYEVFYFFLLKKFNVFSHFKEEQRQTKQTTMTIADLASEYVKEKGLPSEDALRERMLYKAELKMRTRVFF